MLVDTVVNVKAKPDKEKTFSVEIRDAVKTERIAGGSSHHPDFRWSLLKQKPPVLPYVLTCQTKRKPSRWQGTRNYGASS